jgi:Protein of unknown function (DUF3102)
MATMSRRPRPIARPTALKPPRADPQIAQLTRDILECLASGGRHSVHARADAGGHLLDVRKRLAHGDFSRWLDTEVPFNQRTAERAIKLHLVRRSNPALFDTIAPLGIAKASVLITLPPTAINSLVGKRHLVASAGVSMTLAQMSFSQLKEVIAARATETPDASDVIVSDYRRQVRTLIRTIDLLIDNRVAIDEHAIGELHDDLLEAAARLAHAFELDDG